jgi:hypothetical protein
VLAAEKGLGGARAALLEERAQAAHDRRPEQIEERIVAHGHVERRTQLREHTGARSAEPAQAGRRPSERAEELGHVEAHELVVAAPEREQRLKQAARRHQLELRVARGRHLHAKRQRAQREHRTAAARRADHERAERGERRRIGESERELLTPARRTRDEEA